MGRFHNFMTLTEAATAFKSLNDAEKYQKGLADGPTEIWYMTPEHMHFGEKKDINPASLKKTHVLLGKIKETDPEEIFKIMQGENWSPQGEAKQLILGKKLNHTSMSVGDIAVIDGKIMRVEVAGFEQLVPQTKLEL